MSKELRNLWDLINSGNYKQANSNIHKELKKSPGNAYYSAVLALVTLKLGKDSEAKDLVDKIASTGPTNVHILDLLSQVYVGMGLAEECSALFEVASRKLAESKEIVDMWFDTMIQVVYFKGLSKASIAKQKLTNGDRSATFQAVLHMYLSCKHSANSDSEKRILPMVALRFLEKMQPYKTSQEVYIHALTLRMQEGFKVVEYLQSDDVRKWGNLDLTVLLLEILQERKLWNQLFVECTNYLDKLESDNWLHWNAMIEAASNLGEKYYDKALRFIKEYPNQGRNSALALVKLSTISPDISTFESVIEFVKKFGDKRSTIYDLNQYVTTDSFDKIAFLEWLDDSKIEHKSEFAKLNWDVNVSKFKYLLNPNHNSHIAKNIQFYQDSVYLLKNKDPLEYHAGDDFLLIAAIALLKDNSLSHNLEKAAVLLEVAARADRHQFGVRLWLVRIYMLLGAFTKAKGHYDSLSIKLLQNETFSYMVATRLSTIYPDQSLIKSAQEYMIRQVSLNSTSNMHIKRRRIRK